MTNAELELRLQNTEKALAMALKKIDELSGDKNKTEKPFKDFIDEKVYNDLFSFVVKGKIDGRKKHDNFAAFYKRVEIVAGLRMRKGKDEQNYFSAVPLQDLKCSEYDRFGELINDICNLIYDYKHATKEGD